MQQEPRNANSLQRLIRGLLTLLALSCVWRCPATSGQEIRFPSPDPTAPQPVVTPAPLTADASVTPTPAGSSMTPFGPAPAAGAAPTLPPGGYSAPGTMVYQPAPVATLNGTVQPPPPNWDPFAPPGTAGPVAPIPQDPYYNAQPCPPQPGPFTLPPVLATPYRFLHDVSMDYHWFAGSGDNNQLGINDIEFRATFALPMPFFQQPQEAPTPLLITPGFAWHFWAGPGSGSMGNPDMPPRTYDGYIDAAWNPVLVPKALSAELDFSVGVYSDFSQITSQSIRMMGKGMAVIAIPDTTLTLKAGVWYINREQFKLLPAGGLVWKPSPVTRFDILFPNPKFTQMLVTTSGGTEWWWYLSGEYGGGVWTIQRANNPALGAEANQIDLVDYDDIRFALGVDFKRPGGMTGFFEGGYAFQRQLNYASGLPGNVFLLGTGYVHAGVSF
jgi:hypothetical protein